MLTEQSENFYAEVLPRFNTMTDGKSKRIYNPVTKKYYSVRQRTTKSGKAGGIKGLWSSKKPKKTK